MSTLAQQISALETSRLQLKLAETRVRELERAIAAELHIGITRRSSGTGTGSGSGLRKQTTPMAKARIVQDFLEGKNVKQSALDANVSVQTVYQVRSNYRKEHGEPTGVPEPEATEPATRRTRRIPTPENDARLAAAYKQYGSYKKAAAALSMHHSAVERAVRRHKQAMGAEPAPKAATGRPRYYADHPELPAIIHAIEVDKLSYRAAGKKLSLPVATVHQNYKRHLESRAQGR